MSSIDSRPSHLIIPRPFVFTVLTRPTTYKEH